MKRPCTCPQARFRRTGRRRDTRAPPRSPRRDRRPAPPPPPRRPRTSRRPAPRRAPRGQVALGIGDDAALLPALRGEVWAVSTDARVENVHFRWATEAPRTVGATALAAALSDLAAMGGRPRGLTCALAAPGDLSLAAFDGVLRGLLWGARRYGCPLVGGNLTRARETSLVL